MYIILYVAQAEVVTYYMCIIMLTGTRMNAYIHEALYSHSPLSPMLVSTVHSIPVPGSPHQQAGSEHSGGRTSASVRVSTQLPAPAEAVS